MGLGSRRHIGKELVGFMAIVMIVAAGCTSPRFHSSNPLRHKGRQTIVHSEMGTVTGQMEPSGGPEGASLPPIHGTIVVRAGTDTGPIVTSFSTDPIGRFSIKLKPGTYVLLPSCGASPVFTVSPGVSITVNPICGIP